MNTVAVIILNCNESVSLKSCLSSVINYSPPANIYVVDRGSTDDSVLMVKSSYPAVSLIELSGEYGSSLAYNETVKKLNFEYFCLLKSTTKVTENWLKPQIELLNGDKNIAACQPKIKTEKNKNLFSKSGATGGYIDIFGYQFYKGSILNTVEKDHNQYNSDSNIFLVSNTSMMIRAKTFHEISGFDINYCEQMGNTDLCWRLLNQGNQIKYCSKSTIYETPSEEHTQSTGEKTFVEFRDNLSILAKNLPKKLLVPILFTRMVLDGLTMINYSFKGQGIKSINIFKAHMSFYKLLGRSIRANKNHNLPKEIYFGSILFQFYFLNKRSYSQIS